MFTATVESYLSSREAPTARQRMVEILAQVRGEIGMLTGGEDVGRDEGPTVVEVRVQRLGFLQPLRELAAEADRCEVALVKRDLQQTGYCQLLGLPDRVILVPRFFYFPTLVRVRPPARPIGVGSAQALLDELACLNARHLLVHQPGAELPDRLDIDAAAGEMTLASEQKWTELALSVLWRLAAASLEHDLPAFLNLDDL